MLSSSYTLLARILLISLLAGLLGLAPQAHAFSENLHAAQSAIDRRSPAIAVQHLNWILAHEPWRGAALWRPVAQAAQAAGDLQTAGLALRQLDDAGLAGPADWQALGDIALQLHDHPAALGYWQRAVDQAVPGAQPDKSSLLAARRIQVFHQTYADLTAEIAALRQLIVLRPSASDQYRLGLLLILLDPSAAMEPLGLVANLAQPDESDLPFVQSAARLRAGLRTALLFDEPAYVTLLCGRLLAAEDQWRLAYEAFQQALHLRSDLAEAWAYLAEAAQQVDPEMDSHMLRRRLEEAYHLSPDSLLVNALFGLYWLRQELPEQALVYLRRVAEMDPTNPVWYEMIGAALAANADLFAAQEAYGRAVNLNPGSARAWRVFAEFHLFYEIQIEAQGLPAAQQALSLDDKDPANQDTLGLALLLLGRGDEAESYFQAALALDPEFAPALLHLGALYLDRGDARKAQEYLDRAAAQAQNHPDASGITAEAQRLLAYLLTTSQP